jgi:hypothetical protein
MIFALYCDSQIFSQFACPLYAPFTSHPTRNKQTKRSKRTGSHKNTARGEGEGEGAIPHTLQYITVNIRIRIFLKRLKLLIPLKQIFFNC